ncbi:MAG: insulinase family protein, partial [SAR324 cluster bacterium]|nr:insulinase family protein [SAR324 cluster bacterium]
MNLQKCLKEGIGEKIFIFFLCYAVNLVPLSIVSAQSASEALSLLRQNVRERTLSNGMRVLMYRRGIAPVFSAILGVRVGSSDEVPGQTGISHLFEHMAFKGTRSIGSKDYEKEKLLLDELEKIASRTDGGKNLSEEMLQRWRTIHAQLSELWIPQAFSRLFEERGAVGLNASTGPELTQYYV